MTSRRSVGGAARPTRTRSTATSTRQRTATLTDRPSTRLQLGTTRWPGPGVHQSERLSGVFSAPFLPEPLHAPPHQLPRSLLLHPTRPPRQPPSAAQPDAPDDDSD